MNRIRLVLLALMWGVGILVNVGAQDGHDGHDPAASSAGGHESHEEDEEEESHAGHEHEVGVASRQAGLDAVERAEVDEHAGHDHDTHVEEEEEEEEEDEHAGHDHAAHGGEAEGEGLTLTPEQRKRFGIVVKEAGPGSLRNEVRLPGEIVFNEDRVAHLVPRVAGIAQEVLTTMGDEVRAGDVLAVIESRELADAKAGYLAAKARGALAGKYFAREKALRDKQVSSEQDYLEAEQALAEAQIQLRSSEQKLHALGLPASVLAGLDHEKDSRITRYEVRSPINGVVTAKHISLGESLEATTDIFTVVDTSSVWVNLTVYTKNLAAVRPGQEVDLRVDHSGAKARGEIAMVTPFVEPATRSATARVVLNNSDRRWVPGTFVTGFIRVAEEDLAVVVAREAVQNVDGEDVVFVADGDAFAMRPVTIGRVDRTQVEVLAGLEAGTRYVADGAFQIKATVITSSLDSHAGHGH